MKDCCEKWSARLPGAKVLNLDWDPFIFCPECGSSLKDDVPLFEPKLIKHVIKQFNDLAKPEPQYIDIAGQESSNGVHKTIDTLGRQVLFDVDSNGNLQGIEII